MKNTKINQNKRNYSNKTSKSTNTKYWMFTWNNFQTWQKEKLATDEGESEFNIHQYLINHFRDKDIHYVYQIEISPSGTLHLQGYLEAPHPTTFTQLQLPALIHFDGRTGTAIQAINYVTNVTKRVPNTPVFHSSEMSARIDEDPDFVSLALKFPWQKRFLRVMQAPAHPRRIYNIFSHKGILGKSDFCTFLLGRIKAFAIKGDDDRIALAIHRRKNETGFYPKICLMDIPRGKDTNIDYDALEILKSGNLTGTKYSGQTVLITRPHMALYGNFELPTHRMSSDQLLNLEICPITKDFVNPESVQAQLNEDVEYAQQHWLKKQPTNSQDDFLNGDISIMDILTENQMDINE